MPESMRRIKIKKRNKSEEIAGVSASLVSQCISSYMKESGIIERLEAAEKQKELLKTVCITLSSIGDAASMADSNSGSTKAKLQELLSGIGIAVSALDSAVQEAGFSALESSRTDRPTIDMGININDEVFREALSKAGYSARQLSEGFRAYAAEDEIIENVSEEDGWPDSREVQDG